MSRSQGNAREQALKKLAKAKDYQQVFRSQAGERVLQDLILFSGMLGDESSKNDALETQFNSGQRNIVKMILRQIHTSEADLLSHVQAIEDRRRAGHA